VGACGGGDSSPESEYASQLKSAFPPVFEGLATLKNVDSGNSDEDNIAALKSAEADLGDGADAVAALKPPADVAKANDALVTALRDFQRQLAETRSAIEGGDPHALDAFNDQTTQFSNTTQDIKQQLSDAGVDLGG
jgi:hypothetical protein